MKARFARFARLTMNCEVNNEVAHSARNMMKMETVLLVFSGCDSILFLSCFVNFSRSDVDIPVTFQKKHKMRRSKSEVTKCHTFSTVVSSTNISRSLSPQWSSSSSLESYLSMFFFLLSRAAGWALEKEKCETKGLFIPQGGNVHRFVTQCYILSIKIFPTSMQRWPLLTKNPSMALTRSSKNKIQFGCFIISWQIHLCFGESSDKRNNLEIMWETTKMHF